MRMVDKYPVILLDMCNTFMTNFDRFGAEQDFSKTYRKMGGKLFDDDTINKLISRLYHDVVDVYDHQKGIEKLAPLDYFIRQRQQEFEIPELEIPLVHQVFAEHECGTVPQEHVQVIQSLSKTNKLGIVSNIWADSGRFRNELIKCDIEQCFDVLVFSSDIEFIKPSKQIFDITLQQITESPDQILFVGDSLSRDVAGAQAVGLRTAWLSYGKDFSGNGYVKPDYTIRAFTDLPNHVPS